MVTPQGTEYVLVSEVFKERLLNLNVNVLRRVEGTLSNHYFMVAKLRLQMKARRANMEVKSFPPYSGYFQEKGISVPKAREKTIVKDAC